MKKRESGGKSLHLDASAGLSGDMILGALLDLGVPRAAFLKKISGLRLPVEIKIKRTQRASFRALKVDVRLKAEASKPRRWKNVESFIKGTSLSSGVKEKALTVFHNLFKAEARVHGHPLQETHLHEAGADDALVDVLGACILLESLGITRITCSPLNVGSGWVRSSHGILPVPPPAVAELLKNIPVYSAHVREELVTPTGAAIISTLADEFISLPEITYGSAGCGAGGRDFAGFPNVLRAFLGGARASSSPQKVYQVEATVDDSTPQVLARFIDRALELGALDVFMTPVVMKKNRLATNLTILAGQDTIDAIIATVFQETTSIGVRYFPVERRVLERRTETVRVLGQPVGIKVSSFGGEEANVQPEFSDCLKAAAKKSMPVKKVMQLAVKEYFRNRRS